MTTCTWTLPTKTLTDGPVYVPFLYCPWATAVGAAGTVAVGGTAVGTAATGAVAVAGGSLSEVTALAGGSPAAAAALPLTEEDAVWVTWGAVRGGIWLSGSQSLPAVYGWSRRQMKIQKRLIIAAS